MALTGGDRLRKRLAEIGANLRKAHSVEIGFLEGSTYPDGTSVPMVAALDEFGSKSSPPRPFFRNMIAARKGEWPAQIARLLPANNYDSQLTLEQMGALIAGELRESIIDTNDPPLSEVTLMLRAMKAKQPGLRIGKRQLWEAIRRVKAGEVSGLSGTAAKPLVETGVLLSSVDHTVR